jgi:hypothetical protein
MGYDFMLDSILVGCFHFGSARALFCVFLLRLCKHCFHIKQSLHEDKPKGGRRYGSVGESGQRISPNGTVDLALWCRERFSK